MDKSGNFIDARNVYSAQNRLDTRFGSSRFNAVSLGGKVQSLSFFTKSDGTQYTLAKVGTELISVSTTGAHTVIKSGLSVDTVHRGITANDRHIIALGIDGLFSWDGTTFTELGQAAPSAPTLTASTLGGNLITANKYKVALAFYASSIGFESSYQTFTNGTVGGSEAEITVTTPNLEIVLTDIPATASNPLIDKVIIYLKNVTTDGEYQFIDEISLGTLTYTITDESTSSQTPQIRNGTPLVGGGKYLASFNSKIVYAGNNEFPNEVYFSETDLPDAYDPYDTQVVLPIQGQGAVTGLAIGLFSDSVLDPFLVIFKRKSTRIYSEIGGRPNLVTLSEEIGCVSQDSIQVKNGVVYFLSEEGWRAIANGKLLINEQGEAATLGNGDLDSIFKESGYLYEVNRNGMAGTFSVYYPTLDQYFTWVSEGANSAYTKSYVYQFDMGGFVPYEFAVPATCAILGENASGRDMVLFGTEDGFILQHSIMEERSDIDADNAEVAINAFAVLPWLPSDQDGDSDASYNYRELILKAIVSDSPLTVTTYLDYNLATAESSEYDFTNPNSGFILDVSQLDIGVLGDDRSIVPARSDINRIGESLAIGFYQSVIGANMGLISLQVDSSKNGNRNLYSDNFIEEGGFDSDTDLYYASVTESARQAAYWAVIAESASQGVFSQGIVYLGDEYTNGTWRFRVVDSALLIEVLTLGVWVVRNTYNPEEEA